MSDTLPDLTDRQRECLSHLPATKAQIAEDMGVHKRTVQGFLERIREAGVELSYDRDANEWFIADERSQQLRQLSTRHKTSITREVTEIIEEEKATLMRRLRRTEPLQAEPVEIRGRESIGVILGDLHFGDVVEKEFWDDEAGEYQTHRVYDSEIAGDKVATFGKRVLQLCQMMGSALSFDDIYVFLLGDISTGMEVYDGQVHHIDKPLKDQVEESVSALFQLISTFSEKFTTVQVRGVPGNHGTDKPTSAIGANTDLITYGWLNDRLRDSGYDNVDFRTTETHHHLNTTARDWRFHVRHGDDEMEHVDETSRSESDWRGLREEFRFDVAMKGHHHSPSFHKVMNQYPVFAAPSPKPGGEFPSRIGKPDVSQHSDLGWVFGIGQDRPVTWQFLVDDR